MNQYTKGEWRLSGDCKVVLSQEKKLAVVMMNMGEAEGRANAHLIAAAVNACASVNPDNPIAVAESIKDMYEALKDVIRELDKASIIKSDSVFMLMPQKALAKAEREVIKVMRENRKK